MPERFLERTNFLLTGESLGRTSSLRKLYLILLCFCAETRFLTHSFCFVCSKGKYNKRNVGNGFFVQFKKSKQTRRVMKGGYECAAVGIIGDQLNWYGVQMFGRGSNC